MSYIAINDENSNARWKLNGIRRCLEYGYSKCVVIFKESVILLMCGES